MSSSLRLFQSHVCKTGNEKKNDYGKDHKNEHLTGARKIKQSNITTRCMLLKKFHQNDEYTKYFNVKLAMLVSNYCLIFSR